MEKKLKGRYLIAMGYKQGKWFSAALEYAVAYRLKCDVQ